MCNCNNNNTPCNNCQNNYPCNCPPDYQVAPVVTTGCLCCPPGYTAQTIKGVTMCYPANPQGIPIPQVQCNPCEETISTNCVTFNSIEGYPINCFGIVNGDSLTTIINKMCLNLDANIRTILTTIGLNPDLRTAFCELVQSCPSSGTSSTTPVIGVITVTF